MSGPRPIDIAGMVTMSTPTMKTMPDLRLHKTSHPVIYEVNTRVLVRELERSSNEPVTLGTIPDDLLDEWASLGFDAIWLMGLWATGDIGRRIALAHEGLRNEYRQVLPDFREEDVIGSPYAIKAYSVSLDLGGNQALLELRKRLRQHGLGLILDFVANHTARDHHWVTRHPEYYVNGKEGDEVRQPEYFFRAKTAKGDAVIAYGRDPNYPGWTDTAQVNIMRPEARRAMLVMLKSIATLCDGVRCDMAMLLLNDVFNKTWGEVKANPDGRAPQNEFWADAIRTVREEMPDFKFIAESYWEREWDLQQLGFDYTYDKKLYERLAREGASSVYDHLKAEMDYQRKSVRFIENHDEPRAAQVFSSEPWHFAAAAVMATVPGMVLFHEGQLAGSKVKLPVQLGRRPVETGSPQLRSVYRKLLGIISHPVFREGNWKLLRIKPAWSENYSWTDFLAYCWCRKGLGARLLVINYGPHPGQCYVEFGLEEISGNTVEFRDLMSPVTYVRERSGLETKGMYFELPGYGLHIFEILF